MPSPIVNMLLNSKRIELPTQCVFYIDPDLDRGKTTLTDWAGLYGKSIGADPHPDLNIVDAEVWGPNAIKVRSLNGTGDYFGCNSHSSIDITTATPQNPLTIFSIANVDASTAASGWLLSKNLTQANDSQYGVYFRNDQGRYELYLDGVSRITSTTGGISKGAWYAIMWEWDGTLTKSYINNTFIRSVEYTGVLPSRANFRIGCRGNNSTYFKGMVGVQLIAQCTAQDVINWSNKVKLLQRYGIAA